MQWLIRRIHRNPYLAYAVMRRVAPVTFLRVLGCYVVVRPAHVARVLKDPTTFSSSVMAGADPFLLGADPPAHTRVRRAVAHIFTAGRLAAAEREAHRVASRFSHRLEEARDLDLMAELAVPLPLAVMTDFLGVPPGDSMRIAAGARALVAGGSVRPGASVPAETRAAVTDLEAYIAELVDARIGTPASDATSALLHGDPSMRLDREETRSVVRLLITAGIETTTNLIGNAALALLRHPGAARRAQLSGNIETLIDEVLRYDPPAQFVVRRATRDSGLGRCRIPAGAVVMALLGATGRRAADRFDPTRRPTAHLAFGAGPHGCVGASLARLEARIALQAVVAALPRIRLAPRRGAVVRSDAFQIRGLRELWVRTSEA